MAESQKRNLLINHTLTAKCSTWNILQASSQTPAGGKARPKRSSPGRSRWYDSLIRFPSLRGPACVLFAWPALSLIRVLRMQHLRRFRLILLAVLCVVATVAVVVQLRKAAPPEAARLLPGADAFVYVNLQWARRATILTGLPQVNRTQEYQQFINETGVDFERDLEQAAFAVHYPASPANTGSKADTGNLNPPPASPRYSEVLMGHLDAARLRSYFHRVARSVDTEQGVEIFNIPIEDHILRAAILGPDSVALSNHVDPQVIRGIVTRSQKRASPFGGPSFLRTYYRRVPFASMAWAIARVNPKADAKVGAGAEAWLKDAPVDPSTLLEKPAVVVASARLIRSVHLRAETFTANPDEARTLTKKLGGLLTMFKFSEAETPSGGPDADVKAFFESLRVSQDKDRAVLTATMPLAFLQKVFHDPSAVNQSGQPAAPAQSAQKAPTQAAAAAAR